MTSPRQERRKAKKRNRSGSEPFIPWPRVPALRPIRLELWAHKEPKR